MKKWFFAIIPIIFVLTTCQNPDDTIKPDSTKTFIVFDNSHGISDVMVYNSPNRNEYSKVADVYTTPQNEHRVRMNCAWHPFVVVHCFRAYWA